jgi:hypothetical protein
MLYNNVFVLFLFLTIITVNSVFLLWISKNVFHEKHDLMINSEHDKTKI